MMGGAGGSLGRCIEQTHQDEALHKVIFVKAEGGEEQIHYFWHAHARSCGTRESGG